MSDALCGDQAKVTVFIAVPAAVAFEIFTTQIDQWWRRGLGYRISGRRPGVLHLEPFVGGRVFEALSDNPQGALFQMGTILCWEPPRRLAFEWRGANFAPGERTEVEVLFEEAENGTRLNLTHRGWSTLRDDHPARHELDTIAFVRSIGLWWGELLTSFRLLTVP
jgi:uncharacterized protein YndB with AHSA1/START domain